MTQRITSKWTKTTEGAFGNSPSIRKGRKAELLFINHCKHNKIDVTDYESDYDMQLQGVDVGVTFDGFNELTVDVKGNLNNNGIFFVEIAPGGWLFNPNKTSTIIAHINVDNKHMIMYDRVDMQNFINQGKFGYNPLAKLTYKDIKHFAKCEDLRG